MIRYADPRGFVELAVTTNFSFLRGASHPEELVAQAITLGLDAIGIADRNSLAGVVRAHLFLRHNGEAASGLRVLPGTRLVFCDGTPDILAYPRDRAAWGRLCRLLTIGNIRAEKGSCRLMLEDLLAWQDGMQLIALPASTFEADVEARLAGRHFPDFEERGQSLSAERNETLAYGVDAGVILPDQRRRFRLSPSAAIFFRRCASLRRRGCCPRSPSLRMPRPIVDRRGNGLWPQPA